MMLRLLENIHQEFDYQLAITKDPDRTPEGWLFLDKLGQALQSLLKCIALGFIVSAPRTIVLSNLDDLYTIYIQNHETTNGVLFLGAAIKLHMHSFAWDKVYPW